MEDLKKKKKNYGIAAILLAVAQYFMGQAGDMIIAQGGMDHISATIFVWSKAVVSFALLFCIAMWIATWIKILRLKKANT